MTVMACLGPASTNSVAHDLTRVAAPACARHLEPRSCSPASASCALRVRPPSQRGFTYPRLQATRQRRIEAVSLQKSIEFEKNDEPSGSISPRSPLPELESGVLDAYGEDVRIPTQAETIARGDVGGTTLVQEAVRSPDVDYLQELLAIQAQGPRAIGFFGTRNMGFMHQQLIEILSYAMVITNNHIYTSGASGTNAAVIRGALRAEKPDLLTVILPQSLVMQSPESQELLAKVGNVIDMPHNDNLPLIEASRLCNMDIVSHVQQVICFAFHDSKLLMETCREAKALRKIVTLFYLD